MHDVFFHQIIISGYRGRNFTLKMNPRGQHTVFVMDGNTGKTTTIELLRWCFKYSQSEALDNFEHMWNKPAHLLDDTRDEQQNCEITIHFSALDEENNDRFYQFKRVTTGVFDQNHLPNQTGDVITSIIDTLEIDHGLEVLEGDRVYQHLSSNFRFNECAEYFCFDGEKAREVMQMASDSEKIDILLELINRRTTHPRIEEYRDQLYKLRERVLADANTRVTDRAIKLNIGKLNAKNRDLKRYRGFLEDNERDVTSHKMAFNKIKGDYDAIIEQITNAKAKEIAERVKYETDLINLTGQINDKRRRIYKDSEEWFYADVSLINDIKTNIKEKGKLPEPYRKDLIDNCLVNGSCEICGRQLDDKSVKRIKMLEKQVAPHKVHVFLSSDFTINEPFFDPKLQYNGVKQLISDAQLLGAKINNIKMSASDAGLISERDNLNKQLHVLTEKISKLEQDSIDLKALITITEREIIDQQDKCDALKENKVILDQIEKSILILEEATEKIKYRATDIISDVISDGVTSILGDDFTAKLTHEYGLMLGEKGFYGKEKGGYSGRLILSYCFAEAMTVIDPIIVDTPVGNIGSQREALAAHLIANHKQVVLLCLPTELANFSNSVSSIKPIAIKNLE